MFAPIARVHDQVGRRKKKRPLKLVNNFGSEKKSWAWEGVELSANWPTAGEEVIKMLFNENNDSR